MYLPLLAVVPVWVPVWAQEPAELPLMLEDKGYVAAAPTAEEAEAAFRAAREGFLAVAEGGDDAASPEADPDAAVEDHVAGGSAQNAAQNVALEDIRVVLDVNNVTLREVMTQIVEQAASYTGPWTVKWRLGRDNMSLLDEKVNLTAEADFGDFCNLLVERVKNMTGAQLYVTAFAATRVLLVTDTYY